MKYYLEEKEKVLKELNATEEGLTGEEAKKRKEKYGKALCNTCLVSEGLKNE